MSLLEATLQVYQSKWNNWVKNQGKAGCSQLEELISFVQKSFQLQLLQDGVDSKNLYKISAAKKANVLFFKNQFKHIDHKIIDGFIHYIPFKLQPFTKEREAEMSQLRVGFEQQVQSRRQEKLKQDQKLRKQYENNSTFMNFMKRANSCLPNFTPSLPNKEEVTQKKSHQSSYKIILDQKPTLLLCNQPPKPDQPKSAENQTHENLQYHQQALDEEKGKFKVQRRLFENKRTR